MPDEHSTDDPMAAFGPNEWLVDELYAQYRQDRNLVDKAWWSFFEDYTPQDAVTNGTQASEAAPTAAGSGSTTTAPASASISRQDCLDLPVAATSDRSPVLALERETTIRGRRRGE